MNGQIDPWLNGAKTSLPTNSKSAKIAKAFFTLLIALFIATVGFLIKIIAGILSEAPNQQEREEQEEDYALYDPTNVNSPYYDARLNPLDRNYHKYH